MHQLVVDSINRADLDLRRSLFSNVVLSGGTTLCKGVSMLNRSEKAKLSVDAEVKGVGHRNRTRTMNQVALERDRC